MLDAAKEDKVVASYQDLQEHVSRARLTLPSDHCMACTDNRMC